MLYFSRFSFTKVFEPFTSFCLISSVPSPRKLLEKWAEKHPGDYESMKEKLAPHLKQDEDNTFLSAFKNAEPEKVTDADFDPSKVAFSEVSAS